MHNVELLATVDNLKELKGAIDCGADAVYISYKDGEEFLKGLNEGIEYVHNKNKKIYVAIEVVPHNRHIKIFEEKLAVI